MDGVLVDSGNLHREAWRRLCQEEGVSLEDPEFWRFTIGRRTEDALPVMLGRPLEPQERVRLTERRIGLYHELLQKQTVPVPGVTAFLNDLRIRGVACGLATGALPISVSVTLDALGLADAFAARVTSADVAYGKPDPEVYRVAASRLGVPPGECVAFDDAPVGIQAARTAGMAVVGLATGHTPSELMAAGADIAIRNFLGIDWREVSKL
jgi:beta-phosphoglucomutase